LVAEHLDLTDWQLVYQSRSGAPGQPWLEPDIGDVLRELEPGTRVAVVPIGFVSDHIEVIYDLDTEAQAIARERGIDMLRAPTVGVHPKFLQMIRELIEERLGLCQSRCLPRRLLPGSGAPSQFRLERFFSPRHRPAVIAVVIIRVH
jgi:ferrochelatase